MTTTFTASPEKMTTSTMRLRGCGMNEPSSDLSGKLGKFYSMTYTAASDLNQNNLHSAEMVDD